LDVQTPREKSDKGWVDVSVLLGLDAKLARTDQEIRHQKSHNHEKQHDHSHDHQSEVEVLSITLSSAAGTQEKGIDVRLLIDLLITPPKDEVYRIKGIVYCSDAPWASTGEETVSSPSSSVPGKYILNWAFGRWTFTAVPAIDETSGNDPLVRITVVTARGESAKWKKRIESGAFFEVVDGKGDAVLEVIRVS